MPGNGSPREDLAALAQAAGGVIPCTSLGFVSRSAEGGLSFVCWRPLRLASYILRPSDAPAAFLPPGTGARQSAVEDPGPGPGGFIVSHLASQGARRVLTIPLEGVASPSLLWFTTGRPDPLTSEQVEALQLLAEHGARILGRSESTEAELARLRRLAVVEELLTTLVGVLDVRDVFARVSEIANRVIPHDAVGLPVLTDDRQHAMAFATAGEPLSAYPPVHPIPDRARPLLVDPWVFEIWDDLQESPEQDPFQRPHGVSVRPPDAHPRGSPAGGPAGVLLAHAGAVLDVRRAGCPADCRLRRPGPLAPAPRRAGTTRRGVAREDGHPRGAGRPAGGPHRHRQSSRRVRPGIGHRPQGAAARRAPAGRRHAGWTPRQGVREQWRGRQAVSRRVRHSRPILDDPDWESELNEDMSVHPVWRHEEAGKRGYRSGLRLAIRLEGQLVAALTFLSFAPSLYKEADLLAARRIRDRISLHLTRGRGAEAARRATEATARAAQLEVRVRALTEELNARSGYRRVVGDSPPWREALTQATQVASTEATVLLLGESGTGKEVVARFIHRASPRRDGPFIALNCAALPEQLLEAELFGYERGAFTGATQNKPGQLELAAGGVMFLDEVAEMSPSAQAKFLRVLQEREYQRLGGTRVLKTDARIVAATNRDLPKAIDSGQFREDLSIYRLGVFAIHLPALRDRRDDVLPLADAFIQELGRSLGRPPAGVSLEARQALLETHWPGNVRELRNVLERAAVLCDGGLIATDHLALRPRRRRA